MVLRDAETPGTASVDPLKKHRDLHLESPGYFLNALERQVALAAFHLADIGPVHSAGLAHFFLGPGAALSHSSIALSKASLISLPQPPTHISLFSYPPLAGSC